MALPYENWWIWKKIADKHGHKGYTAIQGIMLNEKMSDADIKGRYPDLNTNSITIMRLIFKIEELENKVNSLGRSVSKQPTKPNDTGNHRGVFSVVDENGDYVKYKKGDIVSYDNKTYIANNNILEGMGPLHESSGWKEITPEIIEGGEFN